MDIGPLAKTRRFHRRRHYRERARPVHVHTDLVGDSRHWRLAELHVDHIGDGELLRSFRDVWPTTSNAGLADVVDRLRTNAPLNEVNPTMPYVVQRPGTPNPGLARRFPQPPAPASTHLRDGRLAAPPHQPRLTGAHPTIERA